MPSNWSEVPYWKGIKIMEGMSDIEAIALLSNRNIEDVRGSTNANDLHYFLSAFTFIKKPPRVNEFPLSVKIGNERLIMPYIDEHDSFDFGEISVGQVEDMQAVIFEKSKEYTPWIVTGKLIYPGRLFNESKCT